ncbi:MAG: L-rhamnose mutarotase [Mahellales bacterium]|jgi:L-rhamnose mutarotase
MKKYCLVFELKEEHIKDYVELHKNCWPEHLKALKESGAKELLIYNYKNLSILFYECEDLDKHLQKLSEYQINSKWQATVGPWFADKPNLDGTGGLEPLEKIFDLNEQLNDQMSVK